MHGRPHLTRHRWPVAGLLAAAALAGCGGSGPETAPSAASTACTTALAAAPATALGGARGDSGSPGTLTYGDPAVVVRCGLEPLAPTSQQCLAVDDVDWVLVSQTDDDPLVFVTYGRAPALEVGVPASYGPENASAALADLAPVARALPPTGRTCIG